MADNVDITPGSGATVATDDVSGAHFQKVKLVDGTADSSTAIPGDANGLKVQDSAALADDAGFTPGTSKVFPVGYTADDSSTDVVNEGDIGAARMSLDRKQITEPYESGPNVLDGTASATGSGDTQVIAAQGNGTFIYVTTIIVHNSSTTDTFVNIKSGSTTRLVVPAPAKGGAVIPLLKPLRLADNAALNFASGTGVTTMYVSAVGYKSTV